MMEYGFNEIKDIDSTWNTARGSERGGGQFSNSSHHGDHILTDIWRWGCVWAGVAAAANMECTPSTTQRSPKSNCSSRVGRRRGYEDYFVRRKMVGLSLWPKYQRFFY